jgi:hypothetical protein
MHFVMQYYGNTIKNEDKMSLFDTLSLYSALYKEVADNYEQDANTWWDALSEEDRLLAFYSVCKRIHKGELEDQGSYRHVLYSVFGFGPEAYAIGMECGFLEIHNSIKVEKESSNELT